MTLFGHDGIVYIMANYVLWYRGSDNYEIDIRATDSD